MQAEVDKISNEISIASDRKWRMNGKLIYRSDHHGKHLMNFKWNCISSRCIRNEFKAIGIDAILTEIQKCIEPSTCYRMPCIKLSAVVSVRFTLLLDESSFREFALRLCPLSFHLACISFSLFALDSIVCFFYRSICLNVLFYPTALLPILYRNVSVCV